MRAALILVGRRAALAFWYLVVPLALTALTFRYLVPDVGAGVGPLRWFGAVAREQPLVVAAAATIVYGALVGSWSRSLPGAAAAPPTARRGGRGRAVFAVGLAAAAGAAFAHVGRSARIVSTSMVPTLLGGDRIWIERVAYGPGHEPRRGEVIVFRHAGAGEGDGGGMLVKRVIGLPGDYIAMRDGRPVVNDVPVPSCDAGTFIYFGSQVSRGRLTVEWLDDRAYLTMQEAGPHPFSSYTVQSGEVFVLGDNRGISNDSRSWQGRAGVRMSAIEGRVGRVLFGEDRTGQLDRGRLWAPLGADVHLSGVDVTALEEGVARCLADPPRPSW